MKMGRFISLIDWLACLLILILHHKVAYSSLSSLYPNFSSSSAHRCSHEESFALLQFKTTFIINPRASVWHAFCSANTYSECIAIFSTPKQGSFPKTEHWKEGSDCCSWDGVTCDKISGHVIELDLSWSQLQGPIYSNSSLFQLRHLQSLNLASNNFTESKISSEFGQFAGLTHLNLSNSAIPLEISNLSKLVSLDLSSNHRFSLQFDSKFFSDLEQLEFLDLSNNELEGQIPNSLSNLKKLKVLRLDSNTFRGGFPSSFANLSQLNHLSISSNELTGNIPANTSGFQLISVMDLSFNSFNGTLPAWLFNRPSLVTLDLADNQLTGEIPPRIGNLLNLSQLDLSSNLIGGMIPPALFSLPSLETLDIGDNSLFGLIPSNITGLQKLHFLELSHNTLSGTIPSALLALPSLTSLNLRMNNLTGHVGEFQSNMLEYIDLSNNDLQGANFSSISNLVNLTVLDLSSNNLTGTLELDVFSRLQKLSDVDLSYNIHLSTNSSNKVHSPLPELVEFRMSTCNVSSFPYFLKNLVQLKSLDLSNNKIRGPIPEWLGIMGKSSLTSLNLSYNLPTSSVEILPWGDLTFLDLSFNLLQGALPIPASKTRLYFISNNKLIGKIHPRICDLRMLDLVDFSNNRLSGNIPDCLFNISIYVLNLRRNNFSGTIPEVVGGESLETLDLSENQLHGHVPRSLINCTSLEILNLENNFISDTFPIWLETMPKLTILILGSNKFYGSIVKPRNASAFAKLNVIDLSYNNFSGNLPSAYFHRWKSMMVDGNIEPSYTAKMGYYHDSATLTIKGQKMELARTLTIFKTIDFSNNKFEGKIPESIGYLKSLIVLNLSSNGLMGEIPTSLGNLRQLESLDFSNNTLSRKIPQQLNNLTFLGVFNVSHNNLEGPIPQTGQLSTFPNDSYMGNLGLCGIPLSMKCKEVPVPHPPIPSYEEDQNSNTILDGFNWKSVTIGYGCGTIIGMIIGHIIIRRNEEWVLSLFNIILPWRIKKPN